MAPRFWHEGGRPSSISEIISSFFNTTRTSGDPESFTTQTYLILLGSFATVIILGVTVAIVYGHREMKAKDEMDRQYLERIAIVKTRIIERKRHQWKLAQLSLAAAAINEVDRDLPLRKNINSKRNSLSEVDFWSIAIPIVGTSQTPQKSSRTKSFSVFQDVIKINDGNFHDRVGLERKKIWQVIHYLNRKDQENDSERFHRRNILMKQMGKEESAKACDSSSVESKRLSFKSSQLDIPPYDMSKINAQSDRRNSSRIKDTYRFTTISERRKINIDHIRSQGWRLSKRLSPIPTKNSIFVDIVPEQKQGRSSIAPSGHKNSNLDFGSDSDSDLDLDFDQKECLLSKFA